MMTSVEFKKRFSLLLDGGLGLELLHHLVTELRAEVKIGNPVLQEIDWSPIKALHQIGFYEKMCLKEWTIYAANLLFDGGQIDNPAIAAAIIAQAETEGKIFLKELGLVFDDDGMIVLSPEARNRAKAERERQTKKGEIIPFDLLRRKQANGSIRTVQS